MLDISPRRIFEYSVQGSKHYSLSTGEENDSPSEIISTSLCGGSKYSKDRYILGFLRPGSVDPEDRSSYFVIDMTRMQYGDN